VPSHFSEKNPEFHEVVSQSKKDLRVFARFPAGLRICPKGGKNRRNDPGSPELLSAKRHKAVLKKLRTALERQARAGGPSQNACRIAVRHLDKYWPYLFGHVLQTPGHRIVVPRTNNAEESLFRVVKRQCRRLHGRGHLSRDIEAMLPGTLLVLNLTHTSYCNTVYGGIDPDRIAMVFSAIEAEGPAKLMKCWQQERLLTAIPQQLERLKDLPQQVAAFIAHIAKELRGRKSG